MNKVALSLGIFFASAPIIVHAQPTQTAAAQFAQQFQGAAHKYYDLCLGILGSISNDDFRKNAQDTIILHLATKNLTFQQQQLLAEIAQLFKQYFRINFDRLAVDEKSYQQQVQKINAGFSNDFMELYQKQYTMMDKPTELAQINQQIAQLKRNHEQVIKNLRPSQAIAQANRAKQNIKNRFERSAPVQDLANVIDFYGLLEKLCALLPLDPVQRAQLQPLKLLVKDGLAIDWKKGQEDVNLYHKLKQDISNEFSQTAQNIMRAKAAAVQNKQDPAPFAQQLADARNKKNDQLKRLPKPPTVVYADRFNFESLSFQMSMQKAVHSLQVQTETWVTFGKDIVVAVEEALKAMKEKNR